jgi:hypothetical protein
MEIELQLNRKKIGKDYYYYFIFPFSRAVYGYIRGLQGIKWDRRLQRWYCLESQVSLDVLRSDLTGIARVKECSHLQQGLEQRPGTIRPALQNVMPNAMNDRANILTTDKKRTYQQPDRD